MNPEERTARRRQRNRTLAPERVLNGAPSQLEEVGRLAAETLGLFGETPPPEAIQKVCRIIELAHVLRQEAESGALEPVFARVEDDQMFVDFVVEYAKRGKKITGSHTTLIYKAYLEWTRSRGFTNPSTQVGFTFALKRIGFDTFKRGGSRYWRRKRAGE